MTMYKIFISIFLALSAPLLGSDAKAKPTVGKKSLTECLCGAMCSDNKMYFAGHHPEICLIRANSYYAVAKGMMTPLQARDYRVDRILELRKLEELRQ
jgi:hypothetical protein